MPALAFLPWIWRAIKGTVSFFVRPPGVYVAMVLLCLLALWYARHEGYNQGTDDCEAAHKAAALKEVERQKTAVAPVVKSTAARGAAAEKIRIVNHDTVRYITQEAAKEPEASSVCVPADLADRLRSLR